MDKKLFALIKIALLLALAVFFVSGCGSSDAPKEVVTSFFDSIDTQDTESFLNCFEKDTQEEILDSINEDELEDYLKSLDASLADEYGKKWIKEVRITGVKKGDTDDGITEYTIDVELDDEDEILVLKEKSKYYLDGDSIEDSINSITGMGDDFFILAMEAGTIDTPKETVPPKKTQPPKETVTPKESETPKKTDPPKETVAPKAARTPEALVMTFFESIDKQDGPLFLSCFTEDARKELQQYYEEITLEDMLKEMDGMFEEEFGSNWLSLINVVSSKEDETVEGITYYTVTLELNGEAEEFGVLKVNGKYYIDENETEIF